MLDVVNINACAKFGQNPFIHTQDIERKRNSDIIQGSQLGNELLDVVNINAKFGQNPFHHIPDIERKPNSDVIQGP